MNRATNREGAILVRREHVDDLPALGEKLQDFIVIDDPHWMVWMESRGWPAG